jgi:bacterioferritin (cytochrome b1)
MNRQEILELLNNDLKNELKHLRFYLFHASSVIGLHREEYKELFIDEAKSEMNHVLQFSDLIYGLNGTATDESNPFEKFENVQDIVNYSIKMEEEVVANYVQRMRDAKQWEEDHPEDVVDAQWLEIFLEGQIQNSREDVDNLKRISKNFNV